MYLFQQVRHIRRDEGYRDLHSTMYLFQPTVVDIVNSLNAFTFHYVSISTYMDAVHPPVTVVFTFHYVSISTEHIFTHYRFIHWFTFHYVSISTDYLKLDEQHELDLHSTMYLFQPCWNRRSCHLQYIYIPLCIYFNAREVENVTDVRYLHSTMYLFQPRSSEALYLLE